MKKYRFAKFYLTGLLVAAILILVIGVLVGLYYASESASAFIRSRTLLKEPVEIDTASVFDAFQETADILSANQLVPAATAYRFDRQVPKGKSAQLSLSQINDFESIIGQMSGNVSQLRQRSISKLRESIDQMIAGSRASLPPQNSSPIQRQMPTQRTTRHLPLLFVDGSISSTDVEMLKLWSGFLELKIRSYTPSANAQTLATRANVDLQALIVFLMKQIDLLTQSKAFVITTPAVNNEPINPNERENRIREFMSLLQRFEDSIDDVIAKEWVIDRELETAKKSAQDAKATIHRRIDEAKQQAVRNAIDMARWIVGALIAALLLLVARDFMSALIATAANTGGILEKLAPNDSDDNAKGI